MSDKQIDPEELAELGEKAAYDARITIHPMTTAYAAEKRSRELEEEGQLIVGEIGHGD